MFGVNMNDVDNNSFLRKLIFLVFHFGLRNLIHLNQEYRN